jgi:long-chain-fatty-acid--coA ligase
VAGATISPAVERFVHAAGFGMIAGYGLTETCATVTCDHPGRPATLGSIGRPLPGVEVKIGENNEILVKGDNVMPGYYKNAEATAEAFTPDGWLRTGDAGYLKDGELYITDRIKDLFKTSNGKYIAPQAIEGKLTIDRNFDQVVVVADRRKFVSALIVPNYAVLEAWAKAEGLQHESREALCNDPRVVNHLAERIETLQQDLAAYEKIKRFVLLPNPFTMESGELTNTLKIKRRVVYERYADLIERMYADVPSGRPA